MRSQRVMSKFKLIAPFDDDEVTRLEFQPGTIDLRPARRALHKEETHHVRGEPAALHRPFRVPGIAAKPVHLQSKVPVGQQRPVVVIGQNVHG